MLENDAPSDRRVTLAVRAEGQRRPALVTALVSTRVGELLDWLQVDDTCGPWLPPLQADLMFRVQRARTAEDLPLDRRLAEIGLVDGEELLVLRVSTTRYAAAA